MGPGEAARDWDAIYATHGADHVSRAQRDPGPSLSALDALEVDHSDAVIDVGAAWIDVLDRRAKREYVLWHDRAVFHFLSHATDRVRHSDALNAAVPSGAIRAFIWLALRKTPRESAPRA